MPENNYKNFFDKAYQLHPSIPKGILEAVAFTNSRFHHITHNAGSPESCMGLPEYYGVMGLVQDGKNYFQNNLTVVSNLSHFSAAELISSPEKNIIAYADAYEQAQKNLLADSKIENQVPVLVFLSELPDNGNLLSNYALCTHLYSVFSFLNNADCAAKYNFPTYAIDRVKIFGEENFNVLSSSFVIASAGKIYDKNGNTFKGSFLPVVQSADYPPALWVSSPNYSSRSGTQISAVTIHDTEGSYAGAISWFQNSSSQVSAHYVMRSSDGQCTQMVLEANKAWHVGSENPYTIGIEHEGYASQTGWYTTAMYTSSANLVKDICGSGYGIPNIRTGFWPWLSTTYYNQSGIPGSCTKIKGHQHYPNQTHTDPGPNWDWDYYFKLINPMPAPTNLTAASGTFYDSGGAGGNYSDDERLVWVIAPSSATSVTLTFSSFDTENTWDYLYVYDGTDVWAPLIGKFTGTTNPGTLVASSGKMCIEFRSDCATNASGWNASWTSNASTVTPTNLAVNALGCPTLGVNLTWQNSGSGWFVDVSDDPNFSYYWNKAIPNLTSIGCPGGFALNTNPSDYLAFMPNTTYYWRIWDGTSHTQGGPFTTPTCNYMEINCSGTFDDTGGPSNPYGGNEDWTDIIQPANASSVTMSFTSFDLETNFDSLWIYDGQITQSPALIGIYTGTVSPGTVTANSGVMSVHFKSDPFVNNAGWQATWNCVSTTGVNEQNNSGAIEIYPNPSPDGRFQVSGLKFKVEKAEVFDVTGRLIQTSNLEHGILNLGEAHSGIYLLKFTSGSETVFRKLIIE
ncbi:MAG: N-acetylmuramoyl-L-alanine amidase [Bacteroidetes bacterium]|nr:N-acetylmuramoyl-L-alanine amidase [Bacteroidota bacterium]